MECNPSSPKQNGGHFTYDSGKYIFVDEGFHILIEMLLNCAPDDQTDNWLALVPVMTEKQKAFTIYNHAKPYTRLLLIDPIKSTLLHLH